MSAVPELASPVLEVTVVYAGEPPVALRCKVADGSTVADAIARSGLLRHCLGLDLKVHKVGVFGKFVKLDAPLRDGDRVEVYRKITRVLDDEDDDDDD
jgi:putative ubiquitin-RnfH superfamily antitoxin RatB of RatAB toxin-antitoxin module